LTILGIATQDSYSLEQQQQSAEMLYTEKFVTEYKQVLINLWTEHVAGQHVKLYGLHLRVIHPNT